MSVDIHKYLAQNVSFRKGKGREMRPDQCGSMKSDSIEYDLSK